MWLDRILLISGWIGVGMVMIDLHVYSFLPGRTITHIGAILAGTSFVLICLKVLYRMVSRKLGRK